MKHLATRADVEHGTLRFGLTGHANIHEADALTNH
jgi:hypothetical protein